MPKQKSEDCLLTETKENQREVVIDNEQSQDFQVKDAKCASKAASTFDDDKAKTIRANESVVTHPHDISTSDLTKADTFDVTNMDEHIEKNHHKTLKANILELKAADYQLHDDYSEKNSNLIGCDLYKVKALLKSTDCDTPQFFTNLEIQNCLEIPEKCGDTTMMIDSVNKDREASALMPFTLQCIDEEHPEEKKSSASNCCFQVTDILNVENPKDRVDTCLLYTSPRPRDS